MKKKKKRRKEKKKKRKVRRIKMSGKYLKKSVFSSGGITICEEKEEEESYVPSKSK